jgi:hypothetical protein
MKTFMSILLLAVASAAVRSDRALAQNAPPPAEVYPASPVLPDLTPGYVLIEGDIQVPLDIYRALMGGGRSAKGTYGPAAYWTANLVPYDFVATGGGAVSAPNQTAAVNAMNAIAARAGVIFRPAVAGDANRIRFQNSPFNNSPVGVQGGAQIINITSWGSQIIICHEIYHSLGFRHEQSRPDRGTFVTIVSNNICGSGISTPCTAGTNGSQCCFCVDFAGNCIACNFNFNLVSSSSIYGPYDFDSFMHYGPTAFSCNGGNTITVNAPWTAQWQGAIGQRDHFSYYDAITCRALYPFPNDRWLDRNHPFPSTGTFQQPYNNSTLAGAVAAVPSGGTLLVKFGNSYSAVGVHSKPVTIMAPNGAVLLGN